MADISNTDLRLNTPALLHTMDDMSEAIVGEEPPTLQPKLVGLMKEPYLRQANANLGAYIDIFVENFPGLSQ